MCGFKKSIVVFCVLKVGSNVVDVPSPEKVFMSLDNIVDGIFRKAGGKDSNNPMLELKVRVAIS